MRKEIAFMCLSENCNLERLENNNIRLTIMNDNNERNDVIICDNSEIEVCAVQRIIFDPETEIYEILYIDNNNECVLNLRANNKFLKVDQKVDEYGYSFTLCEINKFDDYPQYRMEIKNNSIITYCISGIYMNEFILLNTMYSQENILEHIRIQNYMSDILKVIFSNNDPNCKIYCHYRDMIYEISDINTNTITAYSVDVYGIFELPHRVDIDYMDFVKSEGFVFTSDMLFVYHDNLIKDGTVIGNINDIKPLLYSQKSGIMVSKQSTIFTILEKIASINNLLELMEQTQNYTIAKYIDELIKATEPLVEIFDSNEFLNNYECNTIITYIYGKVTIYSSSIIHNIINIAKERLNSIDISDSDDTFSEYLGLNELEQLSADTE